MEAYRQLAMMGQTVIIGDFNATQSMGDRGGRQTPEDTAVQMAMQHMGLQDLTATLRGQPAHQPPKPRSADSRIDLCYADPAHVKVTRARYHNLPSKITVHRPLEVQIRVFQVPPASTEDMDHDEQPPIRPPDEHDTDRWMAYYRTVQRILGQQDETDLNPAMRQAAAACSLHGTQRTMPPCIRTCDQWSPPYGATNWHYIQPYIPMTHRGSMTPRTLPHDWTPHAGTSGSGTSAERRSWHRNSNATFRSPSPTSP